MIIRSLGKIIDSVKSGEKPDYEELRYALLACVSLLNIEHRQLSDEIQRDKPNVKFVRDMKLKNLFDAYNGAMSADPKKWIGWGNDPENPEYRQRHDMGCRCIDGIFKQGGEEGDE